MFRTSNRLRLVAAFLAALLLTVSDADAQRKKTAPFRKRVAAKKKAPAGVKVLGRIQGFANWVTSVAISRDGKTLLIGSHSEVKVVDLKSRHVARTIKTKPGYIRALVFSPDGKRLAVGGYEMLQLWDAKTLRPMKDFVGHTGQVTGAAFSPDGRRLVSSSLDESVRLWDAETGKELKKIGEYEYPVNGVAFSPDGRWIATASGDEYRVTRPGIVQLWDAATGREKTWITRDKDGKPRITRLVEHEKAANTVTFSPDGKVLISTSFDEKVNVYDPATGKALGYFDGHGRPTNDAAFLKDGVTVVSAGGGRAKKRNLVMIWSSRDGEKFATLEGHAAPVTCVAVSPDGTIIASGAHDKTVILWDISGLRAKINKSLREYPAEAPKPKPNTAGAKTASATRPAGTQLQFVSANVGAAKTKTIRVGIIGLDTSHVIAFTRTLNDGNARPDVANCRVIVAYPRGSPDIESSTSRVPKYTKQIKDLGVEIVESIPELVKRVDAVLLETNDGRPHLEQVLPVLKAGKPVFVDKPIAGTLADAIAIFAAAKKYHTPVFSSSSLRYGPGTQAVRRGKIGDVKSAETYSPCSLEKTHPDLFWYGIHGVESLFTVMGTGCESVRRTVHTPTTDEVVGTWKGGRAGIFRGYRKGGAKHGYGGKATGTKGEMPVGKSAGYRPLIVEIVKFFRSGKPPVSADETLEIYAFMEAADESKRQGGKTVKIEDVLAKARQAAKKRLEKLDR